MNILPGSFGMSSPGKADSTGFLNSIKMYIIRISFLLCTVLVLH
jgi:hypothetical protein